MKQTINKEAVDYLNTMYGNIQDGYLTIWSSGDKNTRWYHVSEIEKAASYAMDLKENQNVYLGIGVRKERLSEKQRGTNKDISYLPCLFIEIDIKGGTHAAENLPDEKEAQLILDTFPLEPNLVIHSGGGWHCYWMLDEAIHIQTDDDRAYANDLLKRFQNVFIQLARKKDLHIDKTSDLARVLRVPGTYNLKSVPIAVQIIKRSDQRYPVAEVTHAIEALEERFPVSPTPKSKQDYSEKGLPDANPERIISDCRFIQAYLKTKESASYAEWLAALSIGAYCEDHQTLCHEWSEGHPDYSSAETDKKIREIRSKMKPRTCQSIQNEFGGCEGCSHFNKLHSPISLGMWKNEEFSLILEQTIIPKPFHIKDNALFKTVTKKVKTEIGPQEVEVEEMVSRMAPKILKELSNVERNCVHYEIAWKDRGREKREVIPASTLATKRELLTLADKGLPVHDLNYKDLIKYFDKYLAFNQVEHSHMVERLGHIKNTFIHPLDAKGVEIVPSDSGELQLLEGFEVKGTVDSWKTEVFEQIKSHPKVLFMVFASFASVILHDLKVSSFIVDLSGSTSQGKSTSLEVARSVWGNKNLLNEWNATKVAIERKSSFLNSFPLYMDDTRKADERIIQPIVYQFSGGRSKGRGSLKGSQREVTWNNILMSTGEVPISDYAAKAGGAAARVIPLIDEPFKNVNHQYFSDLYKALGDHYGTIGLEFIKKWIKEKDDLIPEFHKFKDHYMDKSKGHEVLTRLSMYYAAVHFAGAVAKKIFNLTVDLKQLDQLFNEVKEENQTLDKPKELLEQILLKLDSSRKDIYYSSSDHFVPVDIKAIYKFDTICLMPSFLKDFLGTEEKMIRREWLKRGFTEAHVANGKTTDYKPAFHNGKTFRVVVINNTLIDALGLDFRES